MVTLGFAEELPRGRHRLQLACGPGPLIATAAVEFIVGGEAAMKVAASRTPEIMADAAHTILTRQARDFTGNFCIDDSVLHEAGVRDFSRYRHSAQRCAAAGHLRARHQRAPHLALQRRSPPALPFH